MGVFRIFPSKDAWITNIDEASNHGESPALNVFARESPDEAGTAQLARTLVQFDLSALSSSIFLDELFSADSMECRLRMRHLENGSGCSGSFDLFVFPLSASWDEGRGIDGDEHTDYGYANWLSASSTYPWVVSGSDYLTSGYGSASQHFDRGDEDLDVDVTDCVKHWLTGSLENYGLAVKLGTAEEDSLRDYYRKVFHGRESKYVDRISHIEVRWDDVLADNRGNFLIGASNNLTLRNLVRGRPTDVAETPVLARVQNHIVGASASYVETVTAARVSPGVYKAEFSVPAGLATGSAWYDYWHVAGSVAYSSGSFFPISEAAGLWDDTQEFSVSPWNLRRVYRVDESARIRVHVRPRDWVSSAGAISSASADIDTEYMDRMYYSVENDNSGETVIGWGTGSFSHTQLSYDKSGNYFDLSMRNFIPGLVYRVRFMIDHNRDRKIIDEKFLFKVV